MSFTGEQVIVPLPHTSREAPLSPAPVIGDILRDVKNLSPEQVEAILRYQKERGVRFGEAAVSLGFVEKKDVTWAIAQQFHYPYINEATGIDRDRMLVTARDPFSKQAEHFREVRSQLLGGVFSSRETPRSLAVVSTAHGDGRTFYAANLAVVLSQLGGSVLLVDADMRTAGLSDVFCGDAEIPVGLSSILSGRAEMKVLQPISSLPQFNVLPVGVVPPNPLELVERPVWGQLIAELADRYDFVVVDTPAAASGADCYVVAAQCGATLTVARKDHTGYGATQQLVQRLKRSPTRLAGVVLNAY